MRFTYRVGDQVYPVDLERQGESYRATVNGQLYELQLVQSDLPAIAFSLGENPQQVYTAVDGGQRWVFLDGETYVLDARASATAPGARSRDEGHGAGGESTIRAPMPGQVRAIQVTPGEQLEKGQTCFLLEAMKMEIRVPAPRAGRLKRLLVRAGQTVERDQLLGEID